MARPKGSTLSAEHKTALSAGRKMASVVSNYLDALEASKPKRGRKRTKDSIRNRLSTIEKDLASADSLRRLQLIQEQMDLTAELEAADVATDFAKLESEFVKVAKTYSDNKGISYLAWRTVGVTPEVLKKANIGRGTDQHAGSDRHRRDGQPLAGGFERARQQ